MVINFRYHVITNKEIEEAYLKKIKVKMIYLQLLRHKDEIEIEIFTLRTNPYQMEQPQTMLYKDIGGLLMHTITLHSFL